MGRSMPSDRPNLGRSQARLHRFRGGQSVDIQSVEATKPVDGPTPRPYLGDRAQGAPGDTWWSPLRIGGMGCSEEV